MAKTYSSPEVTALYAAIGFSLSAWASVEGALCSIFCNSINPQQANPADKAFWAVVSFEGKMDITSDVVLDTVDQEDLRALWKGIENKLRRSAKLRNKVAHGSVVRAQNPKTKKQEIFLAPYFGSARLDLVPTLKEVREKSFDPRPRDRLSTAAVEEIASGFVKLRERLYDFRRKHLAYVEQSGGIGSIRGAKRRQLAHPVRGSQNPPKT